MSSFYHVPRYFTLCIIPNQQICFAIIFFFVGLPPSWVFKQVFNHTHWDEKKQRNGVGGASTGNRYWFNYLKYAYYQVVNVGTLRYLMKEVVRYEVPQSILCCLNFIREKAWVVWFFRMLTSNVSVTIPADWKTPCILQFFIISLVVVYSFDKSADTFTWLVRSTELVFLIFIITCL